MSGKQTPEVLVVVDMPTWAHDYKTQNLQSALAGEYRITRRFETDLTEADLDRADLIMVYYWMQFGRMKDLRAAFMRNRRKLLLGVCSHYELQGGLREQGLCALREMGRGVFTINMRLYRELRQLLSCPVFYTPNGVDTDFFRPARKAADSTQARSLHIEESGGRRVRLKSGLRRVASLLSARAGDGAAGGDGTRAIRVGWAGSLTNVGAEYRGFNNFIVPAVGSVEGAEMVVAAREQRWRGRDEMLEFYRSIDVYVCASVSEGAPNPCLEAAACGVPLVTTRVGNMPELIRPGINGLFVKRKVRDIAAKITLLRDDARLRARMGSRARLSVEGWDWRRQSENYRVMFEAMLDD